MKGILIPQTNVLNPTIPISDQDEEAATTLSKVSDIMMKLELFVQAISWLEKELGMAQKCDMSNETLAGKLPPKVLQHIKTAF